MPTPPRRILLSLFWPQESVARGILRYGREHGWRVIDDAPSARTPENTPVDAIIGMLPPFADHPTRRLAAQPGMPVVELSLAYPEMRHWCRLPESCASVGATAAEHLRRLPVKSFAFFDDTPWWNHDARFEGFRRALANDRRPLHRFHLRDRETWSANPVGDYLKTLPKPCGVFGAVDSFARRVVDLAAEAGLSVPGDLYVAGFGNMGIHAENGGVPLTTVAIDHDAWGYEAARMLDARLAGDLAPGARREFPAGALIVRASTGGDFGGDPLCVKADALMRAHLARPLTLGELAKRLGVSAASLDRAFVNATGAGAGRCYRNLRLNTALGLLESGEKAESVAAAVGYASYRAFSVALLKFSGKSPGRWGHRAGAPLAP